MSKFYETIIQKKNTSKISLSMVCIVRVLLGLESATKYASNPQLDSIGEISISFTSHC